MWAILSDTSGPPFACGAGRGRERSRWRSECLAGDPVVVAVARLPPYQPLVDQSGSVPVVPVGGKSQSFVLVPCFGTGQVAVPVAIPVGERVSLARHPEAGGGVEGGRASGQCRGDGGGTSAGSRGGASKGGRGGRRYQSVGSGARPSRFDVGVPAGDFEGEPDDRDIVTGVAELGIAAGDLDGEMDGLTRLDLDGELDVDGVGGGREAGGERWRWVGRGRGASS